MDIIDPNGYVSHSLNRTHCTFYQNEIYVKVPLVERPVHKRRPCDARALCQDLSRLGRVLRDTILLDNNADCYLFQPENAIPINSWYDDPTVPHPP